MNENQIRSLFSLICNGVIVCWTAVAVIRSMIPKDESGKRHVSFHTFRYFTIDSNVLSALAALLMLPFGAMGLISGSFHPVPWAVMLKYAGAVSVTVTFLTVMVFLGPTQGYKIMFEGDGLYLHLIGPLLAAASFCLLETGTRLTWEQSLLGLPPVLLYGMVYLIQAVHRGEAKGGWKDFYGFNVGGKWPVSFALMVLATAAICVGITALHNLA